MMERGERDYSLLDPHRWVFGESPSATVASDE